MYLIRETGGFLSCKRSERDRAQCGLGLSEAHTTLEQDQSSCDRCDQNE